jgi:hypothetical protein
LLDVFDIFEVAVLRHVYRRMRPIPGIVSAIVAIEHVVSGILEILRGLLAFLHVAAHLDVIFAWERALVEAFGLRDDRIAERDRVILAARRLDRFHDLDREAVAVFKTPAPFIGPFIHVFESELVEEIAFVHGVDFDAIDARLLAKLRGLGESGDHFLDLFVRHLLAREGVAPAVGRSARGGADLVHVHDRLTKEIEDFVLTDLHHRRVDRHAAAETRGDLDEHLAAGLVDFLHEGFEFAVHPFVLVEPSPTHRVLDRGDARKDQSGPVLGPFQ